MARASVIHKKSAMPEKTKRENPSNELMRRTLNTLRWMPDSGEDTLKATNEFMILMKKSGYGDTVISAPKGILKKTAQDEAGVRSFYRLQTEGARARNYATLGTEQVGPGTGGIPP